LISGQVSFDDFSGGNTMTGREVMDINQAREKYARALVLDLTSLWCKSDNIDALENVLTPYNQGTCPVEIRYIHPDAEARFTVSPLWYVTPDDQLLYSLRELLVDQRVKLEFH
jgi:DNA polymerase-3 subunit alpha